MHAKMNVCFKTAAYAKNSADLLAALAIIAGKWRQKVPFWKC
jgi:hypothetical protein